MAGLSEGGSGVRTQYFRTPVLTERWEPVRELAATGLGTAGSTQTDLASDGWVLQASTATFDGVNRVWISRPPGRLVDASPCESLASTHVGVADLRRQFVLCSSNPGMGYMDKELQVTTDGGETFEPVAMAPRDGLTSDFAVADSETIAIGATAGDAGIVEASFDGGASWEFTLFEPDTGPVTDLDFQDAEHGTLVAGQAALGTSQLFRTVDGGHTWQPVDVTVG
ncbi:WD40/YVTN/BNR-like repeat-containing protein [Georgenia deserti]|uniref:WD40/YVTN/BNR-like repeat-containing protein n=1 Tax=Georgenia deserti TaxID=2093781 RepID=A0ABW4L6M0_9MICO